MQKRTLIIAGMHRSGTSLISHWLAKCGLQLGEKLVGPGYGNVDGHFEDVEFLKMHEEVLTNNNLPSSGLTDVQIDSFSIYEKEKLKSIIKIKQQLYDQWGWKDPRTCLFLDVYQELLPDACYLIILRDYQSVVSSLLRREFKDVDDKYMARTYFSRLVWQKIRRSQKLQEFYHAYAVKFLKVWVAYNHDILKCIKKLNNDSFVVINYSTLCKEDTPLFSHLKNNWNFSLKYFRFKDIFKESQMGEDINIDHYITDRALIENAKQLQDELKGYMQLV
ncbi:sulfotransferase [Mucilaginibacter sabulilitoris]|uniref:Sulfotransferase n=1 Tax=Mucilaginibacter sabulilitoris TaxID=1173583 RepID=A0ABZ0TJS8_9SPHI|nr:sulfotransferase [Mucilaginibacter sabulilitoris]WPU93069.1 sulfotransferase [Mucilaginibacter sabulilitoris]